MPTFFPGKTHGHHLKKHPLFNTLLHGYPLVRRIFLSVLLWERSSKINPFHCLQMSSRRNSELAVHVVDVLTPFPVGKKARIEHPQSKGDQWLYVLAAVEYRASVFVTALGLLSPKKSSKQRTNKEMCLQVCGLTDSVYFSSRHCHLLRHKPCPALSYCSLMQPALPEKLPPEG